MSNGNQQAFQDMKALALIKTMFQDDCSNEDLIARLQKHWDKLAAAEDETSTWLMELKEAHAVKLAMIKRATNEANSARQALQQKERELESLIAASAKYHGANIVAWEE
jgi:hypothetical protein